MGTQGSGQSGLFLWEGFFNRVGFPLTVLALMGYLGWSVLNWARPRAERVIDTHLEFVLSMQARMDSFDTQLHMIAEEQLKTTRTLEALVSEMQSGH